MTVTNINRNAIIFPECHPRAGKEKREEFGPYTTWGEAIVAVIETGHQSTKLFDAELVQRRPDEGRQKAKEMKAAKATQDALALAPAIQELQQQGITTATGHREGPERARPNHGTRWPVAGSPGSEGYGQGGPLKA